MITPQFFEDVPKITLADPLADLLGASKDGLLTYGYADVVKLAGHSCPTVAGAYLMAIKSLAKLYGKEYPVRGMIRVDVRGSEEVGTVGVIANVFSLLTGAMGKGGFKGLAGNFARNNRLFFDAKIDGEVKFTRLDNSKSVVASYDPSFILPSQKQSILMQKILSGLADSSEKQEFGTLWQDRVKKILIDFRDDERLITLAEG